MKTRPILFNADMVRAILEGRKTQTRRPMKAQPTKLNAWESPDERGMWGYHIEAGTGGMYFSEREALTRGALAVCPCPFGEPGARLWVREPARVVQSEWDSSSGNRIRRVKAWYSDGTKSDWIVQPDRLKTVGVGRGMPNGCFREASRITLEVERVWVERVQDISKADAEAEGMLSSAEAEAMAAKDGMDWYDSPVKQFRGVWDRIYGQVTLKDGRTSLKKSWWGNPWVWACSFKAVDQEGEI